VLDLAVLFGRPPAVPSAASCVLVTGVAAGAAGLARGLLAEEVRQVLELADAELVPPPRAGGLFAAQWIAALARVEGSLLPILDLANLLDSPPARAAAAAAGG
jgi:purine-binding chemotaxis protein CheW